MLRRLTPALLVLMPVACDGESALSASDTGDPFEPDDASVAGDCTRCFDDRCGWESSECASDPGCAGWLSCARGCPEDASGSAAATCLEDCPDPPTSTGRTLREVLLSCLDANAGCCTEGEPAQKDEDGGISGAGGSGGNEDGGFGGSEPAGMACNTADCESCLLAIKAQKECAVDDAPCATAIADCFHDGDQQGTHHCWTYISRYGQCAGTGTTVTGEACSYALPEGSVELGASALGCAATYCDACFADGERSCVRCQITSCPGEMEAVLANADAQDLLWCREACRNHEDPPACNQGCYESYQAGADAVVELYVCSQSACKLACGS